MNPLILAAVAAMFLMGGKQPAPPKPAKPSTPDDDDDDDDSDVFEDDDDDDFAGDAKDEMDAGLPPGYVADKVTNGPDDEGEEDDDDAPSGGGSSLPPVPVVEVMPDPKTEDDIAAAARDAAEQFERDQQAREAAAASKPPSVTAKPTPPIIDVFPGPENFQPPTASAPAPTSRPLPAGYSPAQARKEAASLAAHLKRAGRAGYDRRMLEAWQKKAGLTPDRIYGGATRGALIFYGVKDPVPAFFAPTATVTFVPPEKR